MHCITIEATTLWSNIDNVAVITYKNDAAPAFTGRLSSRR